MCLAQKRTHGVHVPTLGASTGTKLEAVTDFRILVVFDVGPAAAELLAMRRGPAYRLRDTHVLDRSRRS
jgi:hypothetical protein